MNGNSNDPTEPSPTSFQPGEPARRQASIQAGEPARAGERAQTTEYAATAESIWLETIARAFTTHERWGLIVGVGFQLAVLLTMIASGSAKALPGIF